MIHAVIMAGGSGTRFWPLSRKARPKQLLAIGTPRPLLAETVARLAPLVPPERVKVVVGEGHVAGVRAVCPELPAGALIVEPCARNTAPCVGLAAVHVARQDPDAVMAVLPADHHVGDAPGFLRLVRAACERALAGEIVTLGIRPTRPETGYGYIQYDPKDPALSSEGVEICAVRRFVEKPPRSVAEGYLAHGGYLWNSGMFFFTARRILADIARLLPGLSAALGRIGAAIDTPAYLEVLAREYNALASVSLDYGIMEHAEQVRVVPAVIGWNDVGHWAALRDFAEADAQDNVVSGDCVLVDAHGATIHAEPGIMVAAVGVRELVVVATPDAVLVCDQAHAQEVRKVVQALSKAGREALL